MSASVLPPLSSPPAEPSYELKSELLQSTLPRNQKSRGLFLTWVNTVCAIYLGVGILGAKNPHLLGARRIDPDEHSTLIEIPPEPKPEPEQNPVEVTAPDDASAEEKTDALPVVVPISVIDINQASFARPTEGVVKFDLSNLGTFERAKPNVGIVGTEAKPGISEAPPAAVSRPGRRRFTDDDVDRGTVPLPNVSLATSGRVEVEPGTVIRILFGVDGAVVEVNIFPPLSNPSFEKDLRAHVRKHWHSKIGAISGDWPLNQKN